MYIQIDPARSSQIRGACSRCRLLHSALSESRVARRQEDAALATGLRVALLEQDVPVHAPRRAPAVLHFPVIRAGVGAVAHDEHAVVEGGPARAGHNTRAVKLEG